MTGTNGSAPIAPEKRPIMLRMDMPHPDGASLISMAIQVSPDLFSPLDTPVRALAQRQFEQNLTTAIATILSVYGGERVSLRKQGP